MPSLKSDMYIVLSQKFIVIIDIEILFYKKKPPKTTSFLTKSSNPTTSRIIIFPRQPASKGRDLYRNFFPFFLNRKKKPLPKSYPHFAVHKQNFTFYLHCLLHQAERMLINLSVLHSHSLPSLFPFCSILPPPQGWRSPHLQRPSLLTRRTWRRAKRVRRSFTPSDVQSSCVRNCRPRRRSRTVGFEIGCPFLMRLWQWLPFGAVVARCVDVGQRRGGMAAYWSRGRGKCWGTRTAGDVRGREGGVGTG